MNVVGATGLLAVFDEAGVLEPADVHVALRLGRLGREPSEPVLLAAALAVRAVRHGATCLELDRLRDVTVDEDSDVDVAALPWPDPAAVLAGLRASPLVVGSPVGGLRPLRLVETDGGPLLYLARYWEQEQSVRSLLEDRALTRPPLPDDLAARLAERFAGSPVPDRQRIAAALVATRWTTVLAGGPGTGKTTTVARVLALLHRPGLRVALAAPTGKAAARLQESVREQAAGLDLPADLTASTLHRLLGWRPDSATRFRYGPGNRLPYDVVVVDETSMVSLTMMARLLEAVRPDARLLLVGDPDQLTSVDAGAVLADLVARPVSGTLDPVLVDLVGADLAAADGARTGDPSTGDASTRDPSTHDPSTGDPSTGDASTRDPSVHDLSTPDRTEAALTERERVRLAGGTVRLSRGRRFGGAIAQLATAVREGDADHALGLLRSGAPELSFVEHGDLDAVQADVVAAASAVTQAAQAGDVEQALARLEDHRLLCAHRTGPYGVADWDRRALGWAAAAAGRPLDPSTWYAGQPLLVTSNDHEAKVYNGDTGVVVDRGCGELVAAFARGGSPVLLHPGRLADVQTVYAMTIHRSQGSQYDAVSVVLPETASSLLSRELLYTAVTRARRHVRVIGTQESVRAGIERQVLRASGLRRVVHP